MKPVLGGFETRLKFIKFGHRRDNQDPRGNFLSSTTTCTCWRGGSVGSKHTSLASWTQLGDTADIDMDTDMIRIEKEDRSSLCAKCDGRSSWSSIYRSETICNTECALVEKTNPKSSNHMKECKSNQHKKIKKHPVNFSVGFKCENLFDYECNPACLQAKS